MIPAPFLTVGFLIRPNEIGGHTCKHDPETYRTVQRKLINQTEGYDTTRRDKEKRRERMSRDSKRVCGRNPTVREGAISYDECSTLSDGRVSAKQEDTHGCQCKEDDVNRNHVIENLFIATRHKRNHNC